MGICLKKRGSEKSVFEEFEGLGNNCVIVYMGVCELVCLPMYV